MANKSKSLVNQKPIKVAVLIDAWFPFWGGGQVNVNEVEKALSKNYKVESVVFYPKQVSTLSRLLWTFTVVAQVIWQQRTQKFDLVHSHGFMPGLSAKLISLITGMPCVHSVHGSHLMDQRKPGFKTRLEKWLLTEITYNSLISDSKSFFDYPNVNKSLHYVPNGVDIKAINAVTGKKTKDPIIIFVGRNHPDKGIVYLDKAWKVLEKKYPKVKLKKLTDGSVNGLQLFQAYKKAYIFVLPSLAEGQPISLLDAWACKLPVVVTSVGNNPHMVVNKKNGILIPPKDSKAIVRAISFLLNNPERARLMGLAGYNLVAKNFTWDQAAARTYEIYSQVLGRGLARIEFDPQLLKILACPHDRSRLKYESKVETEQLVCLKCKRVYAIDRGVPVLLKESL